MICPNCGKEIPDESLFCGECGTEVKNVVQKPEEVKVEEKSEVKQETKKATEENNTMSIISIIVAIVGLVLIFFKPVLTGISGIIAIVLGAMGRKLGARSIGTAGLVIGIINVVLVTLILMAAIIMVFTFAAVTL